MKNWSLRYCGSSPYKALVNNSSSIDVLISLDVFHYLKAQFDQNT